MYELPVMVNFSCEVRVALVGRLENDLGAIGQFMRRQVDFSERSLPDQSPKRVVANGFEVMACEFVEKLLIRASKLRLAHELGLSFQGLHPSAPDAAWPRRVEGDRVWAVYVR